MVVEYNRMENYNMITPPPTHNITNGSVMIHPSINSIVISSLSLSFSSTYPATDKSMSVAPKWQYILLYIIPFGTLWGNIFVCLAVYLERRLRHRFNLFLVSLATSDLLCALLVMPVSAWHMIMGQNTSDLALCLVWYSLDIFFTATTIIHMCNISLDRYLALRQPFGTVRTQTRHPLNNLSVRITLSWLIPFSIAGPLFLYALMRQKDSEIDNESKPSATTPPTTTATATSTTTIFNNIEIMNSSYEYFSSESTPTATKTSLTMTIDYFHSTEASYKGCGPNDPAFALTAIFITFILPLIIMIVTYVLTVHTLRKHMKQIQAVQLYAATNKHFTDSNRLTASTTSTIVNQNATNNSISCNNNNNNSTEPPKLSSDNNDDNIKLKPNEQDTTTYSYSSRQRHATNLSPISANISSKSIIPEQYITDDITYKSNAETQTVECRQWPSSKAHWKLTRPDCTYKKQRRRHCYHQHQQQQVLSQTPETTMITFTQIEEPSINTTSSHSICDSLLIKTHSTNTNSNNFELTFDIKDELLDKKSGESKRCYTGCNKNVTVNNNSGSSMKIRYTTRQSSTTSTNRYSIDRIHSAKRAVRVIGVLFIIFLICYLPFFIVYFIDVFCTTCNHCTGPAMAHLEWLGYLSSMLNPFVYHAFNPTFRRTFRRMLRCACFCPDRRRSEYYANWRRKIKL